MNRYQRDNKQERNCYLHRNTPVLIAHHYNYHSKNPMRLHRIFYVISFLPAVEPAEPELVVLELVAAPAVVLVAEQDQDFE